MKYVFLIILMVATAPLSGWLRRYPWLTPKVFMLMGFLPFVIYAFHLFMAAISLPDWTVTGVTILLPEWPGYAKGLEITVLDVLALALYFSLPAAQHPLPFRFSMALYFIAASLSTLQAEVPIAAFFYLWQLARMFLVYAVVTRACADPRVTPAILNGMAAGVIVEAGVEIWQRFGLGEIQPSGTFVHQNLLGMMSHFVIFPFIARLLAGRRIWLPAAVTLATLVADVLTASRATIGTGALGCAAIFILSALGRPTSRKALFLLISLSVVTAVMPLAFLSLESRFTAQDPFNDPYYHERAAFEKAAAMMLADNPFGVGVNHYVLTANNGGYNQLAGVAQIPRALTQNVHNIYWLVAAESGYLGILTFLLLVLRPLIVAFLCGWHNRKDQRGELLLGFGIALLAVYIHSLWEWIFIDFQVQYMFAMTVGMVAGLAQQLGYWRRPIQTVRGLKYRSNGGRPPCAPSK